MGAEKVEVIHTGYEPRPLQEKLHILLRRFNVLVCHRRFGKTVFAINEQIDQALRCEAKNPQYAYFAPTYSQAEKVAWEYIKEYTKKLPGVKVNESKLTITIFRKDRGDKIKIILMGAENIDAARGMYFDGVILDEFGDMDPRIWSQVIRPALMDRGGWAIFIGTPKGQNHFYDIYQVAKKQSANQNSDWFVALFKASETGILNEADLFAAKLEMDEDDYEQEFECSFTAANKGAYFGKLLLEAEQNGRIRDVPYDASLPVYTWWDLGIADSTAIWFTQPYSFSEHRVIDYHEDSGVGLDVYAREIQAKKYIYREHILPHDGGARSLETGKTRQETLRELLGQNPTVLKKHGVADGIQACRMILPKCYFDEKKTERGRECLKNFQKKWDAKNKIFSSAPLHNWASHGADAFRTFAMGHREESKIDKRNRPRTSMSEYDVLGR